ncbi:D-alanyl-D-alanine carboxypeptidase family protein [Paenibacillus lutrae]|uniref:D-alanyl-D-alanine carboxypeptidase n=1 Tax=Paenibacillus lutrae TaxID=2078573 RepID=A0A7X3FI75_9BACL|nr:D-alanyl-D-alanine carboxypeptidase family protein [Paenibacillus lutrae]MVO99821.1 D-alanyl-D-alanine carboxypeptidase [Paenibacillus lutrae]
MKRTGRRLLLFALIAAGLWLWKGSGGEELKFDARSAVLIHADTGSIVYERNGDESLPPASMSKMMTELIVYEEVKAGRASWNDQVRTSRYASEVTGAQIGLKFGERLTLKEMLAAVAIESANDAAVAVAEHIGGTEDEFVAKMNRKAAEIGLSEGTAFANASGLTRADLGSYAPKQHKGETVMTAKDTARLAAYLIRHHPEVLELTRKADYELPGRFGLIRTTNRMLPAAGDTFAYEGSDGLKTGFTDLAGYCFTGTAVRDGQRLISVVMGTGSQEGRFNATRKLLDYGFKSVDNSSRKDNLFGAGR